MPESIDSKTTETAIQIKQAGILKGTERLREQKAIIQGKGFEYIGSGIESVVMATDPNGEKVIAVDYKEILNPVEVKKLYYRHRIMKTLFPKHFAYFHASFTGKEFSGTLRQRIETGPWKPEHSFDEVIEIVNQLELPVGFDFVDGNRNLQVGLNKKSRPTEYYLDRIYDYNDSILSNSDTRSWDIEKIEAYMKSKEYSDKDINRVKKSIKRLETLNKSESKDPTA